MTRGVLVLSSSRHEQLRTVSSKRDGISNAMKDRVRNVSSLARLLRRRHSVDTHSFSHLVLLRHRRSIHRLGFLMDRLLSRHHRARWSRLVTDLNGGHLVEVGHATSHHLLLIRRTIITLRLGVVRHFMFRLESLSFLLLVT